MAAIEAEDRATVREDRTRPRLLLAQRIKPQRDRAVVRALLRVLGVAFAESEIIAPVEAPIDVRFRQAQFHLRELCDHPRGVLGKRMTRWCIRRVCMRTEETSAIQRRGWSALWASLTSLPLWLSTPRGMAPGVSDWMSCSLSMGTRRACPARAGPRDRCFDPARLAIGVGVVSALRDGAVCDERCACLSSPGDREAVTAMG